MDSKQKILNAALNEFACEGFGGARMDKIAKQAGVNKAMIFYYFSSKELLYKSLLKDVMVNIFGPMSQLLAAETDANRFLEKIPALQINFFAKNLDFVRIVTLDLIRNPDNIKEFFKEFFGERYEKGPGKLLEKVAAWYEDGHITEKDPLHFMINIMSLNIFAFIGRPLFEAVFNAQIEDDDAFCKERIKSVTNLLKQGMLK